MQYLRERADDAAAGVEAAFRRSYRTIGPAVFASGVTAIAGFLALASSEINMLRGFALVAVVDLSVALLSTVLLLPAVTMWLEGRDTGGDASEGAEPTVPAEPAAPEKSEPEPVAAR
jgi:predicted RND superfamily exporter protein